MTIREQLVRGLGKYGYKEDPVPRTNKYRVFEHPDCKNKMFVGRAGALRYGRCVTESRAVGPDFRRRVLNAGVFTFDPENFL